MKNFNIKSLLCGLIIGTIGTVGITTVFASGGIKSAKYQEVKVLFNDSIIPLDDSLVEIVKEGENDAKIYMPVKCILENIGYNVNWSESEQTISISEKISTKTTDSTNVKAAEIVPAKNAVNSTNRNETDKKALDIMQKTGNWSYVEPLFPSMTSEGVEEVVALYLQKTGNYKQAEAALPYMNQDNLTQPKTQPDYDSLASETMEKTGDIHSIMGYMSNMSTDKVDAMVKEYIDNTNDFNYIYSVRQFMSTKTIDDTVKNYIDKTGDYGTVAAMLQFMSADASDYVAEKYIKEAKDQQYRKFFTPYLKK